MHALQGEPLPYNHHLHQFLALLKYERGFADATIVNPERWLKPFLAWLVAQDVSLSTVSPVVITKYFINPPLSGGHSARRSLHPSRFVFRLAKSLESIREMVVNLPARDVGSAILIGSQDILRRHRCQ